MIITTSYYTGEIALPNLDKAGKNATIVADTEFYEKEILMDLFGYQLYSDYIEGIAAESPEQKWLDIRDGEEFSFEFRGKTITRKWIGLINSELKSLLAYYAYANIVNRSTQHVTELGVVEPNVENSRIAANSMKVLRAWSRFMEQYGEVPNGFNPYYDSHYVHYDDSPSIYNFLVANSDDYDDWVFTRRGNINVFGF